MNKPFEKVAVVGAGLLGAQIALLFRTFRL